MPIDPITATALSQEHTLQITDDDLLVSFDLYDCDYGVGPCVPVPYNIPEGWALVGPRPWQMRTAQFKGGGYYANSTVAHGQMLRHGVFDNVVESFRAQLRFFGADGMISEIDTLEELLLRRAPRYWTKRREHTPVYLVRALPGETNLAYALLSQGSVLQPQNSWSTECSIDTGFLRPVQVSFIRQPFWLGAKPGVVQSTVQLSALQNWEFQLGWTQETALPAGSVYSFVETSGGDIYASGQSEILRWTASAWAVVNTAPVALAEEVTSSVLLTNGDILFGGNGRIIRRSSAGLWEVESTLPSGQVYALLLASGGEVYAGCNGRILRRSVAGAWSVDSTVPTGYIYSLAEDDTGRLFAGGEQEVLRTADLDPVTVTVAIDSADSEAEQYGTQTYSPPGGDDIDIFNRNYVGLRFRLDIPPNAVISSARVTFTSSSRSVCGNYPTEALHIFCEDVDNSAPFATATNNVSSRTLTSASASWGVSVRWWRLGEYTTSQIRASVQEVVNRAGWQSGNYLGVILRSENLSRHRRRNRREAYSYSRRPSWCPRIVITYIPTATVATNWERISSYPSGNVRSMIVSSISGLLLAGEDGEILGSDDQAKTWGILSTTPTNEVRGLREIGGFTYAGDNGNILRSIDGGRVWSSQSALPAGYVHDFVYETGTADTRAGDNGAILIIDATLQASLGMEATVEDDIFVVNHHKQCNLTHILRASGGGLVFSANLFPMDTFPTALFVAPIVDDDAIYFGVDTSVTDSGPFCNIILDLAQIAVGTVVVDWEYWDSGNWVTLNVHDETFAFTDPGVRGVFWEQPADWATTAVNGTTGYWIRARLSARAGLLIPPTQQNRTIYTCITPFVDIDVAQLGGNVDPIIQMRLHNRSDDSGPGGAYTNLYMNRVWIGAKETEGHAAFRAYLNFADEQNPEGVTVDVTVDPDTATSIQADTNLSSPTGRRTFVDAGIIAAGLGLDNWEDRVAIELDTTIARDFYGTYMPLIICKQQGGSAGEVSIRLKVVSGTGGISKIGDVQVTQSTTDHELIVFTDPITIPVSSQMTDADIGDETSIIVQISVSANDADLYLYGLFLQPTDDAWMECEDNANTAESSLEDGRQLLVDSIAIPKSPTRAIVQRKASNAFVSTWHFDGNGEARIICKENQRLWFHFARTNGAGTSLWLSEPELSCSVRLSMTSRYLFGRGAN